MPTLEFKGKQHIYTPSYRPLRPRESDETRSCNPTDTKRYFSIDFQ